VLEVSKESRDLEAHKVLKANKAKEESKVILLSDQEVLKAHKAKLVREAKEVLEATKGFKADQVKTLQQSQSES